MSAIRDRAEVAARGILQTIAQRICDDRELRNQVVELLRAELSDAVRQARNDLNPPQDGVVPARAGRRHFFHGGEIRWPHPPASSKQRRLKS